MTRFWPYIILVVVFLVSAPVLVAAATAPDLLTGLTAYFNFLLGLAEKGLAAYVEFIKAL